MIRKYKKITEQEALLRLSALCATTEHCQYEMQEKMQKWGLSSQEEAKIIQRLIQDKYIDDERFTRAFVKDKIKYNKWGRRKIEQALWLKHIDKSIQQQVLDEIDPNLYLEILKDLLKSKEKTITAESAYEKKKKLIRFALGRGFTIDLILQCIEGVDDIDIDDEY